MAELKNSEFYEFGASFETDEDVLDFVFENLSTKGWETSFRDMGGYGEPNEMFKITPDDKKDALYNHLIEIIKERDYLKNKVRLGKE